MRRSPYDIGTTTLRGYGNAKAKENEKKTLRKDRKNKIAETRYSSAETIDGRDPLLDQLQEKEVLDSVVPSLFNDIFSAVEQTARGITGSSQGSWSLLVLVVGLILAAVGFSSFGNIGKLTGFRSNDGDIYRPSFVFQHPYVSSSYYAATKSPKTLHETDRNQVSRELRQTKTRLAIVRPFCEFDAEDLPSTFSVWNNFPPCKAAAADLGFTEDEDENGNGQRYFFDDVGSDVQQTVAADVFLFYSQTFAENEKAVKAVDAIIDQFNEPGGWSQCFESIYAIEANIPQELDLYVPSAQEELYNWVNGPNRQFEAAFRIIQSGEWGNYDGFYLMEGDSIPIKNHWLDVVLSEVETKRPFAIMGAKYNGDKWNNFYEQIPLSLINHINGNAVYNTSHPLLERLVGQLEVEAPCPYNSIPYDYRMSQMVTEGELGIVPELAPKIMLNEEGENITLSDNTEMFAKWWDMYGHEQPFKETPAIHNYAATNIIPRHLGPEYIIHGAKLYAPWDPTRTEITLVVSEWFNDRSTHLLENLDEKDHPFSQVVIMLPADVEAHEDYNEKSVVPTKSQHRQAPDYMDLCEAEVTTEWFMWTNSYHKVAKHVDLMFVPGKYDPVVAYTPTTYTFCLKFPYCKETINLAQRFNPGHDKVVQDFDMLYHTESRNAFCKEWKNRFGMEGEDLYKSRKRRRKGRIVGPRGPTGTSYTAYVMREGLDSMYKFTDRSLYGARDPFVKVFAREEKLDGMPEEERYLMDIGYGNSTDCDCTAIELKDDCDNSFMNCTWQEGFEKCRPPERINSTIPYCGFTESPTAAPTLMDIYNDTESPTIAPTTLPPVSTKWFDTLFKSRERTLDLSRQGYPGREDETDFYQLEEASEDF